MFSQALETWVCLHGTGRRVFKPTLVCSCVPDKTTSYRSAFIKNTKAGPTGSLKSKPGSPGNPHPAEPYISSLHHWQCHGHRLGTGAASEWLSPPFGKFHLATGHGQDGNWVKGRAVTLLSVKRAVCVGVRMGEGERVVGTVKFEGEKSLYIWISGVLGPSKIVKIPFFE